MRRPSSLIILLLLIGAICLPAPKVHAHGQACVICRTERCPDKPTLRDAWWCGQGADPRAITPRPKRRVVQPPRPAPVQPEAPALAQPEVVSPPAPVQPEPVAPRPVVVTPPPAPVIAVSRPAPRPPSRLRTWKWATLGIGLGLAVPGAALWGIEGRPSCSAPDPADNCPSLYHTSLLGIPLVATGAASLVASVVLFTLDARHGREAPSP